MSERVLELYESGNPDRIGSWVILERFRIVQFRLAHCCEMRVSQFASGGWNDAAEEEVRLAEALNKHNLKCHELRKIQDRVTEGRGAILSPRQGLQLGLSRADFKLARLFADSIIVSLPEDPEANFAIGMDYVLSGEYARAEPYLKMVLRSRPDDPTVLNNLGVVNYRIGHYDEAERYCNKALEKLPDSSQIMRTLESIKRARDSQK